MRFIAFSVMGLALLACSPCSAWAIYYGPQTRPGTFGTRQFGQPLAPRESQFGGGVQRNANGQFLGVGRPDARMFATPWQRTAPASFPAYVVPPALDLPLPSAPQLVPQPNVEIPMLPGAPVFAPAPMPMPAAGAETPPQ